ncbi:MAG: cytochrome c biogenesis protein CcdA [Candidatus Nanoarchaeia archaeon]|nr:cytochrome c biogenesis protein CcdA [Candidatus Nanoarchaeia archaeon]
MKLKLIMLLSLMLLSINLAAAEDKHVDLIVFYGQGCPHCLSELSFLESIQDKYPSLHITEYEVYFNAENNALFHKISEAFNTEVHGVPTAFIDDKVIAGFSTSVGQAIEQEIQKCAKEGCVSPLEKIGQEEPSDETVVSIGDISPSENPEKTELKNKITLPALISAAAVDAINPCEFAVLIILLTTILAAGIKKRALYAGLAFTLSIFISYYLMGIGLYSAIQAAGLARGFYTAMAVLAIAIGLFNLKDYLWYGKWFIMEVPLTWRPKMKSLLRGITSVPGAFLIGFVISLFLLPCTSGPYIVILGLLAETTTRNHAMLLLLLYNFIFIIPMLGITLAIYFGFTTTEQAEEWRQKKLKYLHLATGAILLLLGIGMFIAMKMGMI